MRKKKKIKVISLDRMIDKHIGRIGTTTRKAFEERLKLAFLKDPFKSDRLHHNLTKDQS